MKHELDISKYFKPLVNEEWFKYKYQFFWYVIHVSQVHAIKKMRLFHVIQHLGV